MEPANTEPQADLVETPAGSKKVISLFHALLGLAILSAFQMVGAAIHRLGLPISGSVLGLILFYFGLSTGVVKMHWVEAAAAFLLRHMLLLFIPVTVGLMELFHVLSRQALAISASLMVSLIAVQATTGLLGKKLLKGSHDQQ